MILLTLFFINFILLCYTLFRTNVKTTPTKDEDRGFIYLLWSLKAIIHDSIATKNHLSFGMNAKLLWAVIIYMNVGWTNKSNITIQKYHIYEQK